MFCEKCGTRNEKEAKFCEKCGTKLDNEDVKEVKKVVKKDKKPITKKQKTTYCVVGIIAAILVIGYFVISSMTGIKNVGKDYFNNLSKEHYANLYKYHNIDSKDELLSKKAFVANVEGIIKDRKININASNTKIETTDTKINITYLDKDSNKEQRITLNYVKDGKKLLVFDNYKITSVEMNTSVLYTTNIIKDVKIEVPVGSTLKLGNVVVTNKNNYNEGDSTKYEDVYNISKMFESSYSAVLTLKSGAEFTDTKAITSVNDFNNLINKDNISESALKKLSTNINTFMTEFYASAIKGTEFSEFSKKYSDNDLSGMQYTYNNIKSKGINSFEIENIKISKISSSYSGKYYVTVSMDYKYRKAATDAYKTSTDSYVYLYFELDGTVPVTLGGLPYIY